MRPREQKIKPRECKGGDLNRRKLRKARALKTFTLRLRVNKKSVHNAEKTAEKLPGLHLFLGWKEPGN